ncbi:TPA: hypothetical protein ACH3X2_011373 [Trebouxia sp. C0005]
MGSGRSVRELTLPEIQIGRHLPLASGPKPPQFRFSTASHGPPSASSVGLQDELGEGSTAAHLVVGGMLPSPLGIEQGARGFTSTLAASERQPALSATGASVGELGKSMMVSTVVMVSNVLLIPDSSPSLAVHTHSPSTSTLAAVSKTQLMLGDEDDSSMVGTTVTAGDANNVPAKLFTIFGMKHL